MNLELEEFLEENNIEILEKYYRSKQDPLSHVGKMIRTLRPGFGGGSGVLRKIESIEKTKDGRAYFNIVDKQTTQYIVYLDNWYNVFEVVDDIRFEFKNNDYFRCHPSKGISIYEIFNDSEKRNFWSRTVRESIAMSKEKF